MAQQFGPPPLDLISTDEAAEIAKVSTSAIYRWIVSGRIRGWKKRGGRQARYFVSRSEVESMWEPVPTKAKYRTAPEDLPASKTEIERRIAAARKIIAEI